MNNNLTPLGQYFMSLPTVYEIREVTKGLQMNKTGIVKSKIPIADKDIQKGIRKFVPIAYTFTIKNIYEGGEKIVEVK
jgi:hypothetical protein